VWLTCIVYKDQPALPSKCFPPRIKPSQLMVYGEMISSCRALMSPSIPFESR